jgi:hypothetical protein
VPEKKPKKTTKTRESKKIVVKTEPESEYDFEPEPKKTTKEKKPKKSKKEAEVPEPAKEEKTSWADEAEDIQQRLRNILLEEDFE